MSLQKSFSPILLLILISLSACGSSSSSLSSTSESIPSSSSSSQTSSESTPSSASIASSFLPDDQYEDSMTWQKDGHLYIHYNRSREDKFEPFSSYENWTIWVWQKAPYDLPGVQIDWSYFDQSGAIAEIDFKSDQHLGHLRQPGQHWSEITRVGFLIVFKPTMNQTIGMWTSDGGTDMYINDFYTHIRDNGTMHLYALRGQVSDYTFHFTGSLGIDPYATDDGDFISESNVLSSQSDAYPMVNTSPDFYDHVGVGYQIFVRSFADSDGDGEGDLRGIINALDYLENLNVKALWLTPIHASETYHGYDVTDFYKINPSLGTALDFAELIYKAKQRDMRIVMDLVVNHTSTQNAWFQNSINLRKGTNSAGEEMDYRSFYHWKYSLSPLSAPWHRFGETNYYYYGKFATSMPELNYDYQGTRDAMIDVAKYWAGFGVSGFRIDAVKHVYMADEVDALSSDAITEPGSEFAANLTKNLNFFKEFNYKLKSVYPNTFIVGENFDGWDQRIAPYYQAMDSQFDFQNYYHLMNMQFGLNESVNPQTQAYVFQQKFNQTFASQRSRFINSAFTSNHDVARVINWVKGTPVDGNIEAKQTILASDYLDAKARAWVFNAATLLMPGVSWIYYGDELGMSGNISTNQDGTTFHYDRWYRQPFKWDNDDSYAAITGYSFEGYDVRWDGINASDTLVQGANQQALSSTSMHALFRQLAAIKNEPTMIQGQFIALSTGNTNVMAFQRTLGNKSYFVYLNFNPNTASISMQGTTVFSWNNASSSALPGYSLRITEVNG